MKNRKLNLILVLPIIIFTLSVLNCNRAELSENSILPIKNSASNNSTQIFDSVQSNTNQIADSIQTNINKPLNNSKNLLFLKEWIGKYPINKGDKNFANFFTVPQVKSLLTEIVGKDGFQNMLDHFVASDQIKAKKDFLEVSGTSIRKVTQDVDYGMIAINLKTGETHVFFVDNEKLSGFRFC